MDRAADSAAIDCLPLVAERWADLEALFGPRGACGGCWCMWWRLPAAVYEQNKGRPNRDALEAIVTAGEVPGLIAYHAGTPVGWCAVGPRDDFPRLDRSRTLKRVDDQPVWSVVCFFVAKPFRRRGVALQLLRAAMAHAAANGATILEGYPVEPRTSPMPDAFAWTGTASTFRRAGFEEVARRTPTRPIMRHRLLPGAERPLFVRRRGRTTQ